MARAALNDPGNAHGIIYMWGTVGIGYNEKMVSAALPGVPLNSWRVLFDPASAKRLAHCGINYINEPVAIVRIALKYLGKDPNAPTPKDFDDAEKLLLAVRPYIRPFDTAGDIEALVNGEICISLGYGGDVLFANKRAREAKIPIQIVYVIPDEGSLLWFTFAAITQDAPHAANAHRFLNYLANPQVIANISNFIGYANANSDSTALDPTVARNPIIYPTQTKRKRLFVETEYTPVQSRAMTRLWQKFKTGQ
jgi:putrescine transport system substrate-binding protein